MGEPSQDFKSSVHAAMLEQKKKKAEKKAEGEARRKKQEAERKKAKDTKKSKDGEEKEDDAKMDEDIPIEDIKVELTEDEKKVCFKKRTLPDLAPQVLAKSYASFTI